MRWVSLGVALALTSCASSSGPASSDPFGATCARSLPAGSPCSVTENTGGNSPAETVWNDRLLFAGSRLPKQAEGVFNHPDAGWRLDARAAREGSRS